MRLSIKSKVSISISCTVLLVLLTYMVLNYYATKNQLVHEMEERMKMITQQISLTLRQSHYANEAIEKLLAEKLYGASLGAAKLLPSQLEQVTEEQLNRVIKELGIAHVSLLQYTENKDDIVIRASTDPQMVGVSTKQLGYWYTALQQLLEDQQVTVAEGHKFQHFWAGPFDILTSNPDHMDKWGYYCDGKRDYIISLNIRDTPVLNMFHLTKPDQTVEQTIKLQPVVLEVTAINPDLFEQPYEDMESYSYINRSAYQSNQPIVFGSYKYHSEQDAFYIQQAHSAQSPIFLETRSLDRNVIKSFIPIQDQSQSYVLSVVMDADPLLGALKEQLMQNIAVGLILFEIVLIGSYLMAEAFIKPLRHILDKVNMMTIGRFDTPLSIKREDEFGVLAERVNLMGKSLYQSTERLRYLYEENRSMRGHLESFINQSTDAIHVTDMDGRVERVNQAFTDMFGWTEDEIKGKPLPILPDNPSAAIQEIEISLSSGKASTALETIRLTKDGRIIDVSVSTSPIIDELGNQSSWANITRDITNRKRMEELLCRSEKLTTVGQLAAGVAHEIRNPLTTLKGFIQLQQQTGKVNGMHTSMMLSELDRINLIVSEFLVLSKPQAVHFQDKDLRKVMHEVLSLLDSLAHMHSITFATRFEENLPHVSCEENQLKQVFINIVKNAIEAMPSGGKIELIMDTVQEDRVRIQICDHGVGIPAEDLSKIGDPFFTKKETGTGLGLMVSQRIIFNHKGTIDIKSKLNEGTSITITLPVSCNG